MGVGARTVSVAEPPATPLDMETVIVWGPAETPAGIVAVRVCVLRKLVLRADPSISTAAVLSNSDPATVMIFTTSLTMVFGVMDVIAGAAYTGTGKSAIIKAINSDSGTKCEKMFFMFLPFQEFTKVEWLPARQTDIRLR